MGALVLACGVAAARPQWREVPAVPDRPDLDPLLTPAPDRVVVHGTDAALAAVVRRLLRTDRLDIPVGYLPVDRSPVTGLWRLPPAAEAVDLALTGIPAPLPLIRDDSGGVLLGLATLGPVDGEAYCDDTLALRGRARSVEVTPDGIGVRARIVHSGPFRRPRTYRGRAFQVGCHPATLTRDGIPHPRPIQRWTWYRHTTDLHAVTAPA